MTGNGRKPLPLAHAHHTGYAFLAKFAGEPAHSTGHLLIIIPDSEDWRSKTDFERSIFHIAHGSNVSIYVCSNRCARSQMTSRVRALERSSKMRIDL